MLARAAALLTAVLCIASSSVNAETNTIAIVQPNLTEGGADADKLLLLLLLLRLSLRKELIKGARYARVFPLPVSAARPTERPSEMAADESS